MIAKQMTLNGVNGQEDAATRVARIAFAAILAAKDGIAGFRLTADTLATALRPALAKELPAPKRVDKRNPLFDALAAGCGYADPITRTAAGQVAGALKDILTVDPTASPEDVRRTAEAVCRKFDGAGPKAVSAHYHSYRHVRRNAPKPVASAPLGWLAKLNELFPGSTIAKGGRFEVLKETEYAFSQLDPSIRAAIAKAL